MRYWNPHALMLTLACALCTGARGLRVMNPAKAVAEARSFTPR